MLNELFKTVLGLSLKASVVILLILLARLVLKRAPRIFSYALWAVVLVRLLCPVTLESPVSVVPSARLVTAVGNAGSSMEIVRVETGIKTVDNNLNEFFSAHPYQSYTPESDNADVVLRSENMFSLRDVPAILWLTGVAGMLIYSAVSLIRLRRRLIGAVPLEGRIYLADHIDTPFVIGLFRPKIYLPTCLYDRERDYVLAHERRHIRRGDHIWRLIAYLALALHWMNPLVWLAFYLSGQDMETSCDEAVLSRMERDVRADYSETLLRFATGRRVLAGVPLAFGEGDTKGRIRNVMRWKKPAIWVVAAAIAAVAVVGAVLLTNRSASVPDEPSDEIIVPGPVEKCVDYPDDYAEKEFQMPEFPNVTFHWAGQVTAITDGKEETLYTGMPVWNLYLCDLNGDGKRELCSQVSIGSGIIDEHIIVYDYANGVSYTLEDRSVYDYTLEVRDGQLWALRWRYPKNNDGELLASGPLILVSASGGQEAHLSLYHLELGYAYVWDDEIHYAWNEEKGCVEILGLESDQNSIWMPIWVPQGEYYPSYLIAESPHFLNDYFTKGDLIFLTAQWVDENHDAVSVDFFSVSSNTDELSNLPPDFMVDLTEETVETTKWAGSYMEGEDPTPHRFTDEEMVNMARILATIMNCAEQYYETIPKP